MRVDTFNRLTGVLQREVIKKSGVFLSVLKQDEKDFVLYQLDNFYVEVVFQHDNYRQMSFVGFDRSEELEKYLDQIDITEIRECLGNSALE